MKFVLLIWLGTRLFGVANPHQFDTLDDCRTAAGIAVNLYVAGREATTNAEAHCYNGFGELEHMVSRQK
jgi:hypothetical protein